jgi:hypothetical protein
METETRMAKRLEVVLVCFERAREALQNRSSCLCKAKKDMEEMSSFAS